MKFTVYPIIVIFCNFYFLVQAKNIIEFSRQSQIDSFNFIYPNIHKLNQSITFIGSGIINIDSLYKLREVEGSVEFINCSIENLEGFRALEAIGDSLFIINCGNLTSLIGLNQLKYIKYFIIEGNTKSLNEINGFNQIKDLQRFVITNNTGIKKVSGFEKCGSNITLITNNENLEEVTLFNKFVNICNQNFSSRFLDVSSNKKLSNLHLFDSLNCANTIRIGYNDELINFPQFPNLEKINQIVIAKNSKLKKIVSFNSVISSFNLLSIDIIYMDSLLVLEVLNNLDQIGNIKISNNISLTHIVNSFNRIDSIGKLTVKRTLEISNNIKLTDISSFKNISYIGKLIVLNNKNLSNCSIESICNHLSKGGESQIGIDNYPGCRSVNQILSKCTTYLSEIAFEKVKVFPNPTLNYINLLNISSNEILIFNILGEIVKGWKIIDNATIDISSLGSGIYILKDKNLTLSNFIIKI